jgi:hypothetical protein
MGPGGSMSRVGNIRRAEHQQSEHKQQNEQRGATRGVVTGLAMLGGCLAGGTARARAELDFGGVASAQQVLGSQFCQFCQFVR